MSYNGKLLETYCIKGVILWKNRWMRSRAQHLPTTATVQFRSVGGPADSVERPRVHCRGPAPTAPIGTLPRHVLDPPPLAGCHRVPLAVAWASSVQCSGLQKRTVGAWKRSTSPSPEPATGSSAVQKARLEDIVCNVNNAVSSPKPRPVNWKLKTGSEHTTLGRGIPRVHVLRTHVRSQ